MTKTPLSQRIGKKIGTPIDSDFPSSARTALVYLLVVLNQKFYLVDEKKVLLELNRTGRLTKPEIDALSSKEFVNQIGWRVNKLSWDQVFLFCERVYSNLLCAVGDPFEEDYVDLIEVQKYFSKEINQIMEEENILFNFSNGEFHRRGRAQTQKALERVGAVLSDPKLDGVKNHYNKARKFFDNRSSPDFENCVKESLCALEAAVEILSGKKASNDFEKSIKQLQGNGKKQIPSPIGEAMIKIHGYRGSGQGVSHAALQGNRVELVDAELILSLVASYITYLVDLFPSTDEIPF